MTVVVNGRFLRAIPTGMHRGGRALVDAARAAGLAIEVVAPPGIADPRVDRTAWGPGGRFGDHLWEQLVLPAVAGGRLVLSLANTAPLLTRRSAVWVHDLAPVVGPHWFRPHMRAYAALTTAGARRAELVLVPSAQVAAEMAAVAPGTRVAVVRTALDRRFGPSPPADVDGARRRWGLERPYVVHVGWPDPRKDVVTAVAAHLEAVRTHPHDLVLVGRPHATFAPVRVPEIESVRVLGYVADDDLPALLTGAAALVFPSLYEGFGLPPAEAMACGTPALVSDLPALRESTWGRARYLACGDVRAWTEALCQALDGGIAAGAVDAWTAADMAAQLMDALDGA